MATVLASAHHHSSDRKGKTKVVAHEGSDEVEYGDRSLHLQESGRRLLRRLPRRRRSTVARCPVDCGPTLTMPVSAELVDWWTPLHLSFSSLLAEQEAKEAEELEANLAAREQQLLEEVERPRTSLVRDTRGSPVEVAAAWWSLAKLASKRKAKRRKKKLPQGGTRPRMVHIGRRLQRNTWFDSGTFLRQSARSSSGRGKRTLLLRPLVSGSLFFCASPAEYIMWNFLGDPFRKRSRIQRFLVRLWIHIASVCRGFWVMSRRLYVKVNWDPAVHSLSARSHLPSPTRKWSV